MDAMPDALDPSELLGIDVEHRPGPFVLVAPGRILGLDHAPELAQAQVLEHARHRRAGLAELGGDLPGRPAPAAQPLDLLHDPRRQAPRDAPRPRAAIARVRLAAFLEAFQPLVAVRRLTPAASAAPSPTSLPSGPDRPGAGAPSASASRYRWSLTRGSPLRVWSRSNNPIVLRGAPSEQRQAGAARAQRAARGVSSSGAAGTPSCTARGPSSRGTPVSGSAGSAGPSSCTGSRSGCPA